MQTGDGSGNRVPMLKCVVASAVLISLLGCNRDGTKTTTSTSDSVSETPGAKVSDLAAAKAAEQSLHSACDEWSAAHTEGKDTTSAVKKIAASYGAYMSSIMANWRRDPKTRYIPNAAYLIGDPIIGAGKLGCANGSIESYVACGGRGGFVVAVFDRAPWTDRLPAHGFAASLYVKPPELAADLVVGTPEWVDAGQRILRAPYSLGNIRGIIEMRRQDGLYPWTIHPDRGVIEGDGWYPVK